MSMRKRLLFLTLLLAGILCLAGCDQTKSSEVNASEQEETKDPDGQDEEDPEKEDEEPGLEDSKEDEDEEDGDGQDADQPSGQTEGENTEVHSPNITVYYSNEDATAFDSEEIQMGSFSEENVLNALVDKGVVTADVKILSLEVTEVDGKDTLEIDFNSAFASYISSMGTTGEYYIMGGVCNTFLDAYECEQIKITVEGGVLETGHAEYPGYMTKFS